MRFAYLIVSALICVAAGGCKKDPPPIVAVSGVVQLNGQPLPFAEVRFHPLEEIPGHYIATGVTDAEGRFTLTTNGQSGACACAHKVTITEGPPPDERMRSNQSAYAQYLRTLKNRPIPEKYNSLGGEPVEITVTAGQSDYVLVLTR